MTGGVSAAVSAQRSLGIELLEALLVRGNATVSPYLLALKIQRRTDAVITVSIVVGARISVLLVDVRRALTGLAGAHFRKIAFVGRFPAHDATREQLHFQNRSRLDLSRGSSTPKQWFRSVERKGNLDLPIYLPSSSLYTPSVRFHLSTRLLYSWLSGTYIFRQRGGRMEAWNVWRGTYPRCWSTIEIGKLRSERGEERREGGSGMQEKYFTLQSLQQGPVAHCASEVSLQVIGSQQGSYSWHSSIDPQSHCSPSSITLFPQDLLTSTWKRGLKNENFLWQAFRFLIEDECRSRVIHSCKRYS